MAFGRTNVTMLKPRVFNGFHGYLHSFKSFILYSTFSSSVSSNSKEGFTNPLMVEYLVKSVGFTEDEAVSITTKVSYPLTCTKKSQLVVDFLKNIGFDATQIRKVVSSSPDVLRNDVEKTLNPKIRVFQELGFSGSDLGLIVSRHPRLLHRSLKAHIVPSLEVLRSLFGSHEQLLSFLLKTKSPLLFSSGVIKNVPDNLLLLQSYGVQSENLEWLMRRRPLFLLQRTQWVEKIVKGVEEKLGIPRTSGMFMHGVSALSMKREDKIEPWLELFRGFGWSEADIAKLLRKHPSSLNTSENSLRAKLKYFMEDLGYGSEYLATHPVLLSYSMEKKIVPRTAVMKALMEKQLLNPVVSFYTFVSKAESEFVEKYVLPFKDKLPELYEYYTKTTVGSLSKASLF